MIQNNQSLFVTGFDRESLVRLTCDVCESVVCYVRENVRNVGMKKSHGGDDAIKCGGGDLEDQKIIFC
jgi:hypothetical protein